MTALPARACSAPTSTARPSTARAALALAALWLALPLAAQAHGDERPDQDRARAAVRAGEVMPLPQLLEQLKRQYPGQVLALELEREWGDGRWIYEVKLLQPGGQVLKLVLDARSGEVLKQRGRVESPR